MAISAPLLLVCPVMIGRADQLDAVCQQLERTAEGRGQSLLIAGEAGVGKSRLLTAAKAFAAQHGFMLLEGSCFPQDSACPYSPLLDMLRAHLAANGLSAPGLDRFARELAPLLPDLVPAPTGDPLPALEPAQQQRRLFEALAACLVPATAPRPVLLLIEDLHWSDEGSLDFLLFLLRRSAGQPVLLLGTYRSDEVHERLGRWLGHLEREHRAHTLSIAALTRDEVATMLRTIFALPRPVRVETLDAIYSLTEGNPFFIEEILKSLVAAGDIFYADGLWDRKPMQQLRIPRSLNDAVQQRVAQLSPDARQVLVLAAVVGRRFDFALLQRLAQRDEADLLALIKELIAAQLVVEESADRFAFRHALTRQTIYAGLLVRERAALHRQIGEAIEHDAARTHGTHLADLAYHYFEAGSWERALEYARRAGERAQALDAPLATVEQFTRALVAADALAATPLPALYLARGHAYETLGDFEQARADYERALQLAQAARDGATQWQSMLDLGQLWAGRDYQEASNWFQRALDLAQSLGEPRRFAQSLNRLGNWHVNRGQAKEGLQLHEQALALFEAQHDQQGMADTLDLLGMANGLSGDLHGAVRHFGRAIERYRALGDYAGLSSALASRAYFSGGVCGGPSMATYRSQADCAGDLAEALQLARQIEWSGGQAYAEYHSSRVFETFGEYGTALLHARQALQIATSIEHRQWIVAAHWSLGQCFVALLAPNLAIHDLLVGLELARALGSRVHGVEITSSLAAAYLLNHDARQAEAVLAATLPRDQPPRSLAERRMTLAWGELALAQGAPARALAITEQLIASAPGAAPAQPNPALLKLQGEALLALGQLDEALGALEAASDTAQAQGLRPLLWQTLRSLGHAQQRLGRRKEARQSFAAAREIVGALAATVDQADLRDQFTRAALASLPKELAPTPQRSEVERFGGLTERERAVAALIAQGRSNQEIASALVVSKRTVETHVGNVMAKLGASTRAQVVAWAIRQGLTPEPT